MIKWAKRQAAVRGYNLNVSDPGNDLQKQVAVVETWIQQKVDAIVAVVAEPAVFEKIAAKARKNDIVWVTYADRLKNEDGNITFGPHVRVGNMLAQAAADWQKTSGNGSAKAAIIAFRPAAWGRNRLAGVMAGLKRYAPNVEVVSVVDAILAPDAAKAVGTILQAHPDLNIVLGITESSAEGAFAAFRAAGHEENSPDVFIAGADGSPKNLGLIQKGTMLRADIGIRLRSVGRLVADIPANILEGQRPNIGFVKPDLLTKETPELIATYNSDWK
jgi:ribose transport system substrate-binding protein